MAHYLMKLEESCLEHSFMTYHLVEAEDRQKVKYHYHRTLKDWGYTDAMWGDKHALQRDELAAEIHEIRELTQAEYGFLKEFLFSWPKV